MRNGQSLNLNWKFCQGFQEAYVTEEKEDGFQSVHIPHTVQENPIRLF